MFFFAPLFFPLPVGTSEPRYSDTRYSEPAYYQPAQYQSVPAATTYMTQTTYVPPGTPGYYYIQDTYVPASVPVTTTYYYPPATVAAPISTTVYSTETLSNRVSTHNRHWKEKGGVRVNESVLTSDDQDFDGNLTKTTQKTTTKTHKNGTQTVTVETTEARTDASNGQTTTHYLKKVNDTVVEDKTTLQSNS